MREENKKTLKSRKRNNKKESKDKPPQFFSGEDHCKKILHFLQRQENITIINLIKLFPPFFDNMRCFIFL